MLTVVHGYWVFVLFIRMGGGFLDANKAPIKGAKKAIYDLRGIGNLRSAAKERSGFVNTDLVAIGKVIQ